MIGVLVVAVLAVAAWALFVPAADWLATHDVGHVTGSLRILRLQTARDAARGRLLTFGAGLFALAALVFTARNFALSREGQVTDRYTKAIEQLGSDKLDVRLGGIYALERVARDSARDHPTVMEVLAAFIREHSHDQWPPAQPGSDALPERKTRPDVQAGLTVIGRRNSSADRASVDLAGADLTKADLTKADLAKALLTEALLTEADLYKADLTGAYLDGANLTGANLRADLTGAYLNGANLTEADLTEAYLYGANLTGANLTKAYLTGAYLTGAYLDGADLTGANLDGAYLYEADLTRAILTEANLNRAAWPNDPVPPLGWERDPDSGRLKQVRENPGATAQPLV